MKQPKKNDLKNFALIWSLIFLTISLIPLFNGNEIRVWALSAAFVFGGIAFTKPSFLSTFYNVWIKIGEFMGNIISKVIIVILFYGIFTPIALILKLLGKDLLGKKLDQKSTSYWIKRESQPGSLKNQF